MNEVASSAGTVHPQLRDSDVSTAATTLPHGQSRRNYRVQVLDRYVDTFNSCVADAESARWAPASQPQASTLPEDNMMTMPSVPRRTPRKFIVTPSRKPFKTSGCQPESCDSPGTLLKGGLLGDDDELERERRNRENAEMLAHSRAETLRERDAQLQAAEQRIAALTSESHSHADRARAAEAQCEREAAAQRGLLEQVEQLKWRLACHQADADALDGLSVEMLEELERAAVHTLSAVHRRRERMREMGKAAEESRTTCVVCMSGARQVWFEPCGHVVCCFECSLKLQSCCACRAPIWQRMKAYL